VSVDDGFLYIAYEVPKAWIDNPNGGTKTVSKVVIAVILPQVPIPNPTPLNLPCSPAPSQP